MSPGNVPGTPAFAQFPFSFEDLVLWCNYNVTIEAITLIIFPQLGDFRGGGCFFIKSELSDENKMRIEPFGVLLANFKIQLKALTGLA